MLVFGVCGVIQNLFIVFSLYHNPGLDDRIFDCLLTSMAWKTRMCVPLSCLWMIWMAVIGSGWVLWPRTIMVLLPLTSQLCLVAISWLSKRPMHVVNTWRVAVIAPIGNSDLSSLWRSIRWLRSFQTCVLVEKFSLDFKSIGIQSIVQYRYCPGVTFGLLTILLRIWTSIWPCCLDVCTNQGHRMYTLALE